jgi:hypothetical protein
MNVKTCMARTVKGLGMALLGALAVLTGTAGATTITVEPLAQGVGLGDSVDVAINVSGLGDMSAPSLGTFDLDVLFDVSMLAVQNVAFGDPVLGDQLDVSGLGAYTEVLYSPGSTNLFELSFDLPSDLESFQAGSFTLAVLTFDTLQVGTSAVNVDVGVLGDAWGNPIVPDTVGASVSVIPEPTSAMLFGVGCLIVAGSIRKKLALS